MTKPKLINLNKSKLHKNGLSYYQDHTGRPNNFEYNLSADFFFLLALGGGISSPCLPLTQKPRDIQSPFVKITKDEDGVMVIN